MLGVVYRRAALVAGVWDTDTIEWLALTDNYSPDVAADEYVADVVADELSGVGYTRWSATGCTISYDGGDMVLDCDDPEFGTVAAGETMWWAVAYRAVTTDADSELICALRVLFPTDGTTPVTVVLPEAGVLRFGDADYLLLEPDQTFGGS